MIGIVNIIGDIGDLSEFTGQQSEHTTLLDVITQVESNKTATSFNVFINSKGGLLGVGYQMHDYLKTLTVPITTFAETECCSIATAPFLAGSKRVIREGCTFMIHAPLVMNMTGNANVLEEEMKALRDEEKELVNFYHKSTGASKEALTPLLNFDTVLSADQAVQLGFATEKETLVKQIPLQTNIKAVAYSDTYIKNKKQMNDTLTKEEAQGLFNKIGAQIDKILKRTKPVNIVLQDSSGVEVDFPDVEEGQSPGVESRGLIDGAPAPDGSYSFQQLASTLVFAGGVVTEVIPDDDEATAALKSEIEQLKTQLTEKEGQLNTANTEQEEIRTQVLGLKTELTKIKALAGKIEPSGKKIIPVEPVTTSSGLMKAEFYDK